MSEPDEVEAILDDLDSTQRHLVELDMLLFGIGFIDRETKKRLSPQDARLFDDGVYTLNREEPT